MSTTPFNIDEQYATAQRTGGFQRTVTRGLLEVTGGDQQSWLHNLTTNVINSLKPGDGNYAFAISAQGRTVFDLNVLVLDDRLWLDIDTGWIAHALAHLNKYIIVEDVQLADISADWARFAVLGPRTADCVAALGLGNNFDALADVQHVSGTVDGTTVRLVKNNLGPISRAEFIVAGANAEAFARTVAAHAGDLGMVELDSTLFATIRIEAGVPASLDDIDDQVIPPETLQVERGISYVKGCYLGQEVIERMRSRGSMARRLVGMRVDGDRLPEHGAPVFANDREVGRVTSACRSPALGATLALGYIKTLLVGADQPLLVAVDANTPTGAQVVDLPLAPWRT